jgi:hypothetical protein
VVEDRDSRLGLRHVLAADIEKGFCHEFRI